MLLKQMEPFGLALKEFHEGNKQAKVIFHRDDGLKEDHYVSNYFRSKTEFSTLEKHAISLCHGKVLDIGAGVGPHSLELQNLGLDVLAIDISSHACEIMKKRGVRNVICTSVYDLDILNFDTILLMGRSIGFVEDLSGLKKFLMFCKNLLNPGGHVIFDSLNVQMTTNPVHLAYQEKNRQMGCYIGEIRLQMEFKGVKGEKFQILFVDSQTLKNIAQDLELNCVILNEGVGGIYRNERGDFLVKISY
ncbi:MAG: class I SAM-dependent methyltransferase [Promethearchaeota archaeon]|jgi:2-polyprenyl-3-methyl-5-hydroxy-6-metoxy-1,4-benzoquinol methylase